MHRECSASSHAADNAHVSGNGGARGDACARARQWGRTRTALSAASLLCSCFTLVTRVRKERGCSALAICQIDDRSARCGTERHCTRRHSLSKQRHSHSGDTANASRVCLPSWRTHRLRAWSAVPNTIASTWTSVRVQTGMAVERITASMRSAPQTPAIATLTAVVGRQNERRPASSVDDGPLTFPQNTRSRCLAAFRLQINSSSDALELLRQLRNRLHATAFSSVKHDSC
jgi:hypothetical protein